MNKRVVAALATVSLMGAGLAFKNAINPYEKVFKIADGDTIILEANKQTVRLFGIDAPEPDNCYGPEAAKKLDRLLSKRKVQLKEPVVDHFGRIVALVYVDGKLINEVMIREGFASYQGRSGNVMEFMKIAHDYAVNKKLGIYSSVCTDSAPPDPKCVIKGNHDLDRDENVYLSPKCPYYDLVIVRRFEGDRWFCTEDEAKKAGFTISPACALGANRSH